MDGWKTNHEAPVEKCEIANFWRYIPWHIEFLVILSLWLCKGMYVKDCIKVQSIVLQIVVGNIIHNGYILQWYNAFRIFLKKLWYWREPFRFVIHYASQWHIIASIFLFPRRCVHFIMSLYDICLAQKALFFFHRTQAVEHSSELESYRALQCISFGINHNLFLFCQVVKIY